MQLDLLINEILDCCDDLIASIQSSGPLSNLGLRRSARLPRSGAEGGRDTMAAMAGLRNNFVAADGAAAVDPGDKPAFEAV